MAGLPGQNDLRLDLDRAALAQHIDDLADGHELVVRVAERERSWASERTYVPAEERMRKRAVEPSTLRISNSYTVTFFGVSAATSPLRASS